MQGGSVLDYAEVLAAGKAAGAQVAYHGADMGRVADIEDMMKYGLPKCVTTLHSRGLVVVLVSMLVLFWVVGKLEVNLIHPCRSSSINLFLPSGVVSLLLLLTISVNFILDISI